VFVSFVIVIFSIYMYKYFYKISVYKAREPRECNKAYVKDCFIDT